MLAAAEVAARLRRVRPDWLPHVFPAGKTEGGIFYLGNADGDAGRSLPIPLDPGKGETLSDFGGSFQGDDLDLYARGRRLELPEAMAEAARFLGVDSMTPLRANGFKPKHIGPRAGQKDAGTATWEPVLPVPDDAPRAIPPHRLGKPSAKWAYRDANGDLLGMMCRFDRDGGGKDVLPLVFARNSVTGETAWRWQAFPSPRPLYGLDRLAARPGAPVLVVEGEKTTDAAAILFPGHVAVTSPGGSKAADKADWSALAGRRVVIWPDNDPPGRSYAEAVARLALAAGASSIAMVQVPAGWPDAWDLADEPPPGVTADDLRDLLENAVPFEEPGADASKVQDALADFTDPTALQDAEPPPREMIVPGWLPVGAVAALYGAPGVGKSLLSQLLASAVASGKPFLGLDTMPCKVLAVYCEDDGGELHRRQNSINAGLGIGMRDLGAFRYQGRYGELNVMAHGKGGVVELTPFYDAIRGAALKFGARLVVLDNIAQLFGGDENSRTEVTQFVNALGKLAQDIHGAVLLLGHPGKGSGSEYSGSTAWDAAVRTRWLLERVKPSGDEQDATELADMRVLRKPKANYGSTGDEIVLRWDHGTFRLEGPATYRDAVDRIEARQREREDEAAFLDCLDALNQQGRPVSHSPQAGKRKYAPHAMAALPQAKGIGARRLERAMERLFDAGTILANMPIGRRTNRHPLYGIARAEAAPEPEAPAPECAEPAPSRAGVRQGCPQPIDFIAPECCAEAAPECATVTANPLKSLRRSAPDSVPIDTTYLSVPPAGGGGTDPHAVLPEPDDDAEFF